MRVRASPMINADFQCSGVYNSARLGHGVITVGHSCKDGRRAMYWMVVCMPGLRWAWIDARDIGAPREPQPWPGAVAKSTDQRLLFIELLRERFSEPEQIWAFAIERNLPRHPLDIRSSSDSGSSSGGDSGSSGGGSSGD